MRNRSVGPRSRITPASVAQMQPESVPRDDLVGCKNIRCRKRFEVVGIQSVADLQQAAVGTAENRAERIRAAFGRRTLG